MKKSFSIVTVFMLALMAVLIVYFFSYFMPAQQEMTAIRSEITVYNAESAVYRQYINDVTPLEENIAAVQAEIDDLHNNGYVNDSTVGMVINEAIQRYKISIKSISLEGKTMVSGFQALPIHLNFTGSYDSVMAFISHFENNSDGSYMVRAANLSFANNNCSGSIVIYLCTPSV